MKKIYANMILVVVTVVWGGGFIATDGALDALSPFYIMMIRCCFATADLLEKAAQAGSCNDWTWNRDRDISVSGVCLSNLWLEVFNAE